MSKRNSGFDPAGGMEPQRATDEPVKHPLSTQGRPGAAATATLEHPDHEPDLMAGGGPVSIVDKIPDMIPPGKRLLIANEDLPFLSEDGIPKNTMFLASPMRADMLIRTRKCRETFPPVWVATLDQSGVLVQDFSRPGPPLLGGFQGDGSGKPGCGDYLPGDAAEHNRVVLTRARPLKVSHEAAVALIAQSELAARAYGFETPMCKVITEEQAAAWDPDNLPPSPRPNLWKAMRKPEDDAPHVKIRALGTCMLAGVVRVAKDEEREVSEVYAVLGAFLKIQTSPENPHAPHQCEVIGRLSEQGQAFWDAMQDFHIRSGGRWCMQSVLPNYFDC